MGYTVIRAPLLGGYVDLHNWLADAITEARRGVRKVRTGRAQAASPGGSESLEPPGYTVSRRWAVLGSNQ
jgi:hypothetical protein